MSVEMLPILLTHRFVSAHKTVILVSIRLMLMARLVGRSSKCSSGKFDVSSCQADSTLKDML